MTSIISTRDSEAARDARGPLQSRARGIDGPQVDERVELLEEVRLLARYLVSREPTEYVSRKYVDCHRRLGLADDAGCEPFDRLLLDLARRFPRCLPLLDSYTSVFFKHAILRKKLVVLLAVLECSPPFCDWLDAAGSRGPLAAMAMMALRLAAHVFRAASAALVLGPARWWCGRRSRNSNRRDLAEVEGD